MAVTNPYHMLATDGMKFHLQDDNVADKKAVTPRVRKHHYKIAVLGGSDQASCQYFDPEGTALFLLYSTTKNQQLLSVLDKYTAHN